MIKFKKKIINKLGLHARASAKLTQICSNYESEIWVLFKEKKVNAKSIMGVMMLAASYGSTVVFEIKGIDQESAKKDIINLIDNKFDELE